MAVFSLLLAVSFATKIVAVLFVITAVVLVLAVLIQKGRGGGLSSAFGGAMASGLLGSKTGDFLTWVTIVLVGLFLTFAVVLAKYYKSGPSDFGGGSGVRPDQTSSSREPNVSGGAGLPGAGAR
jgi:preprotein translocase subunit SecG